VRSSSPLRKKRGVWVFHAGKSLSASTTNDALQAIRETQALLFVGKGL
jgi:hypothetical protein